MEEDWTGADFAYVTNDGTGVYSSLVNSGITITYTSVYGGVDYRTAEYNASINLQQNTHFAFPTATNTENLTFKEVRFPNT